MFTPPYRPLVPKGSYDQYGGGYTGGYAKEGGGYGPRGQYGDKQILGAYGKRFLSVYSEYQYGPGPVEKPYYPHPPGPQQNYYQNQDQSEEIHCSTCDVWCYGVSQYNSHTRGSRHQKQIKEGKNRRAVSKMKFIKYDEASNTYECTYCGTALNSCSVVMMHIGGVRHQDRAYEIEGLPPAKEVHKKLEEETKTTPEGVTVTTIGDYTTFHCKECNVSANSETQMAQHLASQRHLAKDQWKPNQRRGGKFKAQWVANGGEGPPMYKAIGPAPQSSGLKLLACEICNIMVNSAAQMAQHTASLKHKNNLAGIRYEPYV